jgi:hypothetical protein
MNAAWREEECYVLNIFNPLKNELPPIVNKPQ